MDTTDKAELANILRELHMLYKHIASTSTSLLAMQRALEEVSPDRFASAFERHFLAPDLVAIKAELERHAQILLDKANFLIS